MITQLATLHAALSNAPLAIRAPAPAYPPKRRERLESLALAWSGSPMMPMLGRRAEAYDREYGASNASDLQALADFENMLAGANQSQAQMTLL